MNARSVGQQIYDQAMEAGEIDWDGLLNFAAWHNSATLTTDHQAEADQWNRRLVSLFKEGLGGDPDQTRVMLYGLVGGVYLSEAGHLQILVQNKNIIFQWSEAQPLLVRTESLWQRAIDWWPSSEVRESRLVGRSFDSRKRQRNPHFLKAFDSSTWILSAIYRENEQCRAGGSDSSRADKPPKASEEFSSRLSQFRAHLDKADDELREAFQRDAQIRYGKGLLVGTGLLAVLCGVIGAVVALLSAPASYVVAIPAGGLGGLLSVLQRMTKGDLHLDIAGNRELMWVSGALRPVIGAIFGIAVAALVAGGLSSTVVPPEGRELAFFGGLAFLAGFSERFAQDMLATAGTRAEAPETPEGARNPASDVGRE
jgi:hypothetical protein